MGEDDQCKILEKVNISTLLAVAQVDKHFHEIAASVFKENFGGKTVEIRQRGYNIEDISGGPDRIEVDKLEVIAKLFKYFGHVISSVIMHDSDDDPWIHYSPFTDFIGDYVIQSKAKQDRQREIINLINKNSDGLKSLSIHNNKDEYVLEFVEQPFINVEKFFLFDGKFKKLGNNGFVLNKMFPKLKQLHLNGVRMKIPKSLAVPHKHLESFDVKLWKNDKHEQTKLFNEEDIENLIKNNPQIKFIKISYASRKFLKFVSDSLLVLENLHFKSSERIQHDQISNDFFGNIHFNNVTSLSAFSRDTFVRRVTFKRLENVKIYLETRNLPDVWIDLLKHNNVRNLEIFGKEKLFNIDLMSLTQVSPNLVQAVLDIDPDVKAGTIFKFLQRHQQLKVLKLRCKTENKSSFINNFDQLQIENEWTVTNKSRKSIFNDGFDIEVLIEKF